MKIAVLVKEVPAASAPKKLGADGRLVREGDQVLNPYDSHAIEAALQLREAGGAAADATVVAVSMGPERATAALKKALTLGADEAVHIADEALAGSDIVATARALAAHLRNGSYDLVLLGQQAADSDCWLLASALGELLGMPVLTQASKLELAATSVTVERQTESGYEGLSAPLPALVSVSDALNEPRYPSMKAIMAAKKKPTATVTLADLGLAADQVGTAGSGTNVLGTEAPPAKAGGVKIEDDGSAAEKIVEFLAEKQLV